MSAADESLRGWGFNPDDYGCQGHWDGTSVTLCEGKCRATEKALDRAEAVEARNEFERAAYYQDL